MKDRKELDDNLKIEIDNLFKRYTERINHAYDSVEPILQLTLEFYLLLMRKSIEENPGKVISMGFDSDEEWSFFVDIVTKIDLPPDICTVFISPSTHKSISTGLQLDKNLNFDPSTLSAWKRGMYTLVVSHYKNHNNVMHVTLPAIGSIGIDFYRNGNLISESTFDTIEQCLSSLSEKIWLFFSPKGKWVEEEIVQYTENWYAKSSYILGIESVPIHTEFSYVHNPSLLKISPLEALFKLVQSFIAMEFTPLDKAIRVVNDINQDREEEYTPITEKGILKNNIPECKLLFDHLTYEIDLNLDNLRYIEEINFPQHGINDSLYNTIFLQTVLNLYKKITGKEYPESITKIE
jgi:hypothetical protein